MRKAIHHLKQADPVLSAIIEHVGPYKINYDEPAFASPPGNLRFDQFVSHVLISCRRLSSIWNADQSLPGKSIYLIVY